MTETDFPHITVIYDGECEFCISCLTWVKQKVEVQALTFQSADLTGFNLSRQECAIELHVLEGGQIYRGAAAVAHLLRQRGNTFLAAVVTCSGPLARFGYRWVAAHRGSVLVQMVKAALDRANRRYEK